MRNIWLEDIPQGVSPWTFLFFVSRPYRWSALFACLLVIVGSLATVAGAYMFKQITDSAQALIAGGPVEALWYWTAAYVALSLFAIVFWRGSGFVGMHWSVGVRATSRYSLTAYVTRHSQSYFNDRFGGSISSKISQASSSMRDIVDSILWNFLPFIVSVIGSFGLAFHVSPPIAFIFFAWVLVITPFNIFLVRKGVPLAVSAQKSETALGGATVDMITNINAVHEYARRALELTRLKELIVNRRETGLANWRFRETVRLINGILQIIFIGGMIAVAAYLTGQGVLSAGDIVLILTIVLLMEDRLTYIGNQLNNFGEAWGQVVESLGDIMRPIDVDDRPNAVHLRNVKGDLLIDAVSFKYQETQVFDDLTIRLKEGERVGLVGRSGAGKSTLMKLLLRHHDVTTGSIKIDGVSIADMTKESLRQAIAVVPQEPLLFHRSVRDNIAYGRPDATDAEIHEAAKSAQADIFIDALPGGYGALVGERGVKLSGGQRQRVVIARAILKNAPILLLDEATSALDSESEVAVQKALLTLMENRTVIAIAHRLSTLRAMNRIIVMDAGKILEDGTHEELLAANGLYAKLWNHQAGGFLEE